MDPSGIPDPVDRAAYVALIEKNQRTIERDSHQYRLRGIKPAMERAYSASISWLYGVVPSAKTLLKDALKRYVSDEGHQQQIKAAVTLHAVSRGTDRPIQD